MKHYLWILPLAAWPTLAPAQTTQEDVDKGYLINLIEENLSGVSRSVSIDGFRGALSSEASLDRLTIADEEGVWLTLEDVVLDWNRSALLRGRIDISELSAAQVTVARAPISDGSGDDVPSPEAQSFSLPDLPVSIAIGQFRIDDIALGESFLGEPVNISLAGSADLAGGEGAANVTAIRLNSTRGKFIIDGDYSNETRNLRLNLDADEGRDGIAARLLDLPGRPALSLAVAGEGPIDTFGADLTLATDGTPRVTGTFARSLDNDLQGFMLDIAGDLTPLLDPAYHDFFGAETSLAVSGRQLADGRYDLTDLDLRTQRLALAGAALIGAEGWPNRINLNGTIMDPSGAAVLLPLSGPQTFVNNVLLDVAYDQAISEDWTASFTLDQYQRPGLEIASLALDGGGILRPGEGDAVGEITAVFDYRADGLQLDDPGQAEAFGDTITGVLNARRVEDAPAQINALTLRGPGLEADVQATIGISSSDADIISTIALRIDALDRFSTLAGRALNGGADVEIDSVIDPLNGLYDITVSGETRDLKVDVPQVDPLLAGTGDIAIAFVRDADGTRLENFNINTAAANITADADLTSSGSDARFDAEIRDISVIEPTLEGAVTLRGTATQNALGSVNFDVTGRAPDAIFTANGTADPANPGFTVLSNVKADVRDLETYAGLAGQPLDGAVDATISGVLQTEGGLFDGTFQLVSTNLETGIAELDPLLVGTGTIDAGLRRSGPDSFALRDLEVRLPEVTLDAEAMIDLAGPIDARFDFALTDVGLVLDDISGPAAARGTAVRGADGITLIDVTATAPNAEVIADVAVAEGTNAISGEINARLAAVSDYAALIGQPLSGAVSATVTGDLLPDLSEFDVDVSVTTQDIGTGIAQADILLAGRGALVASAARDADGIRVPRLTLKTPQIAVDATLRTDAAGLGAGEYDILLNDVGPFANGLSGPATAKGTAAKDADGTWTVQSDVTAPGATIKADVAVAPQTNAVSGTLQANVANLSAYQRLIGQPLSGGVSAQINGRVLPDLSNLAAQIDVTTSDLAIGNPIADILLRGPGKLSLSAARTADGFAINDLAAQTNNVTLTGDIDTRDSGASQGRFDARLRDVGVLTDQLSGPVTATGTASISDSGVIGIDVNGSGPGGITFASDGQINPGGTLDLRANGQVPLGLANAVLEPRRISGDAQFALAINGQPALDAVTGRVTIDGARLAAPTLSQALENLQGSVALANGTARVNITGDVQSGGQVAITGPVALAGTRNADLALALRDIVLRDPELYQTSIDGRITVQGPLAGGAQIVGRLALGQADVQVPSSGVGSLGTLPDVVHIGDTRAARDTRDRAGIKAPGTQNNSASAGGPRAVYPLDIIVNAPSRIFIRGRGLDAELGGSLSIGGTTANIIPTGQFSLLRGRLDILQQRFELTEGVASLQGDFSPYIRLVAVTEARTGTEVRIIVEGPANAPEVSFDSTPSLPQDEVLSQLIFGRNLSQIGPLQAVQLAAAVGTLAGSGGAGLIDGFRQELGLDDFDVTTDEDGNAAVRAGAYVSENVYTDVTINAEGETEINLNLDITDEITATGTVDQSGETSLGIFFQRDY